MKTLFLLIALLIVSPLFAAEPNLQESELQLILQRKQGAAQEWERGKIMLDYGSGLMRDTQRTFNELTIEENRLREQVLKLRSEKKSEKE